MSYDLQVYAETALSAEEMRALVVQVGLDAQDTIEESGSLTVVRGSERAYTFSAAMPAAVEGEDVPEEVVAALPAPSFMYFVMVEGSSPVGVRHAVKYARRLAEVARGAVHDQQTGRVWIRGKLVTPPRTEQRVFATVEIHWYVPVGFDAAQTAAAWTRLAQQHVPQALPRRYGATEPLQHRFIDGGADAFVDYVHDADGMVHFTTRQPALGGHLAAGPQEYARVTSHRLTMESAVLDNADLRKSLRQLFTAFAQQSGSVLATAEVQRGRVWYGRQLGTDGATERTIYLGGRGPWSGLPPYPVWWTWFGPDYVPLVLRHLPADLVERSDDGLFHWRSEAPADRDVLTAGLNRKSNAGGLMRLLRRIGSGSPSPTWLPAELLPVIRSSDPNLHNPPMTPAQVRPSSLE
jgi:hypothetical protein